MESPGPSTVTVAGRTYEYRIVQPRGMGRRAVVWVNLSNDDVRFAQEARAEVARRESLAPSDVLVENRPREDLAPGLASSSSGPTPEQQVSRARELVRSFLGQHGITPGYQMASDVHVVEDSGEWTRVILRNPGGGYATPENTEAITPVRPSRGVQINDVWVNGNLYSVGTIVHEFFHTLSHDITDSALNAGGQLGEGITEYFTCLACGLYVRKDRNGFAVYSKPLFSIRKCVENGDCTLQDLIDLYFMGDSAKLHAINAAFFRYFEDAQRRP